LNSVLLAVAVTALSLAFNVAAGYAFAKLRFRGRDRIFRAMLGALVIPSQVAMVRCSCCSSRWASSTRMAA
jgi:multiple sugar transport system permease protein